MVKSKWLFIVALVSCVGLKSDTRIVIEIQKRISDNKITGITVSANARGVTITAGNLNFPADSAELTDATAKRLDALGKLLKGYEDKKILVVGHTAAVGDAASQLSLSKLRARTVADYLIKKAYAKSANIIIEGKGGSVPLDTNTTEEGRTKNRRVEITLLRE